MLCYHLDSTRELVNDTWKRLLFVFYSVKKADERAVDRYMIFLPILKAHLITSSKSYKVIRR